MKRRSLKGYKKYNLPVAEIRRYLEPGPVTLVTSCWKGRRDIMTMAWHTVMEFTPSLVGCIISDQNYSFELIRKSRECVINIPTQNMAREVIGIGNCSGADADKFEKFGLTPEKAARVQAPLIHECHTSLECRLADARLVKKYNFFIFEVVKAHAAKTPRYPKTLHYRGDGLFMLSGGSLTLPSGK